MLPLQCTATLLGLWQVAYVALQGWLPLADRCGGGLDLPNPFGQVAVANLYDAEGLKPMGLELNLPHLYAIWEPSSRALQAALGSCSTQAAIGRLLSDGLLVNELGMDFSGVQQRRYGLPSRAGDELLADGDVLLARAAYFGTRVNRFLWEVDAPHWYRPTPEPNSLTSSESRLLADFRRDGFVKVPRWDGLDMAATQAEVAALSQQGWHSAGADHYIYQDVRSLGPMMDSGSLAWKLVLGYLGADARYDGMLILRLHSHAKRETYSNAPWHHDGCGQRLKLFLYLTDVDERTHPTMIVPSTQRMHWYPTTQYFAGEAGKDGFSKLSPSLVRRVYGDSVAKMTGPAGGGFIFDTNALHGADVEGEHKERDAIVLEFATVKHLAMLPRGKRGPDDGFLSGFNELTCPSPVRAGERVLMPLSSAGFGAA